MGVIMEAIDLARSLQADRIGLGITALNGVMGHKLEERDSPLAVRMGFYYRNSPMALTRDRFEALDPGATDRLVIFLHGLASHEQLWAFPLEAGDGGEASYGSLLMRDHGFTPLYLRYNSGLRVSHNGRLFAALLEELLELYPVPVREVVLVGHSLGGLLIRSACHYGEQSGHRWLNQLSKAIYLGTPHLGIPWAPLIDRLYAQLASSQHPVARKLHGVYEKRSPSMRDATRAAVTDEHWDAEPPTPAGPWYEGAEHCFVAGSINANPGHPLSFALGDVLVTQGSAHADSRLQGDKGPPDHVVRRRAVIPGVKHIALVHNAEVYAHIAQWVGEPGTAKGFIAPH